MKRLRILFISHDASGTAAPLEYFAAGDIFYSSAREELGNCAAQKVRRRHSVETTAPRVWEIIEKEICEWKVEN